jgi:hypothetical protein
MLDSGPPPSPLPSSLVADPAQEAVEEVGRDFLKALDRILSDNGAIPRSKEVSVELS